MHQDLVATRLSAVSKAAVTHIMMAIAGMSSTHRHHAALRCFDGP